MADFLIDLGGFEVFALLEAKVWLLREKERSRNAETARSLDFSRGLGGVNAGACRGDGGVGGIVGCESWS